MQLALVVEADGLRNLGDDHAAPEQLPGAGEVSAIRATIDVRLPRLTGTRIVG